MNYNYSTLFYVRHTSHCNYFNFPQLLCVIIGPVRYRAYYFSPSNLGGDFFLRSQMDTDGWVPLTLIASFYRIRNMSTDLGMIAEVRSLVSPELTEETIVAACDNNGYIVYMTTIFH